VRKSAEPKILRADFAAEAPESRWLVTQGRRSARPSQHVAPVSGEQSPLPPGKAFGEVGGLLGPHWIPAASWLPVATDQAGVPAARTGPTIRAAGIPGHVEKAVAIGDRISGLLPSPPDRPHRVEAQLGATADTRVRPSGSKNPCSAPLVLNPLMGFARSLARIQVCRKEVAKARHTDRNARSGNRRQASSSPGPFRPHHWTIGLPSWLSAVVRYGYIAAAAGFASFGCWPPGRSRERAHREVWYSSS